MDTSKLTVALAQISPVWLDREATTQKVLTYTKKAADQKADLVIFGESLLPGYPWWLGITNGSSFNNKAQKEIHSHYAQNAVCIEDGDLASICELAAQLSIAIYLGIIERPKNRGGHSLYCSLVYIDQQGTIQSVHRKLQPTYEERLTWAPGDGHGLRTHKLGSFTLGGLNCWENWMPLSRTALYAMGEDLHISVWPGCERNTIDITRYIAQEGRSYVISVSGLMRPEDIPLGTPHRDLILASSAGIEANGGSCIANPDGSWLLPPQLDVEGVFVAEIDHNLVLEERQNFDPVGHYSRPDVTSLTVNRQRQSIIKIEE